MDNIDRQTHQRRTLYTFPINELRGNEKRNLLEFIQALLDGTGDEWLQKIYWYPETGILEQEEKEIDPANMQGYYQKITSFREGVTWLLEQVDNNTDTLPAKVESEDIQTLNSEIKNVRNRIEKLEEESKRLVYKLFRIFRTQSPDTLQRDQKEEGRLMESIISARKKDEEQDVMKICEWILGKIKDPASVISYIALKRGQTRERVEARSTYEPCAGIKFRAENSYATVQFEGNQFYYSLSNGQLTTKICLDKTNNRAEVRFPTIQTHYHAATDPNLLKSYLVITFEEGVTARRIDFRETAKLISPEGMEEDEDT